MLLPRLTLFQLYDIVLHPRDKDGNILWPEDNLNPMFGKPEQDLTLDDHLLAAQAMALRAKWSPEIIAKQQEQIRHLWSLRPNADDPQYKLTPEEFARWQQEVEDYQLDIVRQKHGRPES